MILYIPAPLLHCFIVDLPDIPLISAFSATQIVLLTADIFVLYIFFLGWLTMNKEKDGKE